jgi:hypothetical protein
VTGTGFFAGLTTVSIGGNPASGVVVGSPTSLAAVTPAGTTGARDVVVTAPGGTATLAGGFTYVTGPAIASLDPPFAMAGSGAVTLAVTGTGFISGSIVRWNGSDRATTFVGATRLTAAIPASDLAAPRTVMVTVYNPPGATSNGVEFMVVGGTATRSLPVCYTTSAQTVSIHVSPAASVLVQAVEDAPPSGWPVSEISDGGGWDDVSHKVKWGPFFDNTTRTLTYKVTPPEGQSGPKTFTGQASFDGLGVPIGGLATIESACQAHPADLDMDFQMLINEVTGYGAAWKRGDPWDPPPSPIDINYVTRAGYLWRSGESYRREPSVPECPLCWVPSSGGTTGNVELTVSLGGRAWTNGQAFRTMSLDRRAGAPLTVAITVTPDASTLSWAVRESVPEGWMVVSVSTGGVWDRRSRQVRWGLFLDNEPRTLSYSLAPLEGSARGGTFEGACSFDGVRAEIDGRRQAPRLPVR